MARKHTEHLGRVITEEEDFTTDSNSGKKAQANTLPAHKRRGRRVDGGTEPYRRRCRRRSAANGVHCAPETPTLSSGQQRLQLAYGRLHKPPRRRPQGGNDTAAPPSPDPKPGSRFPPVLEAGKHGQRRDDASMDVAAPVGVAVVRFKQGFLPALPSTPTSIGYTQQGPPFGHHRREAS